MNSRSCSILMLQTNAFFRVSIALLLVAHLGLMSWTATATPIQSLQSKLKNLKSLQPTEADGPVIDFKLSMEIKTISPPMKRTRKVLVLGLDGARGDGMETCVFKDKECPSFLDIINKGKYAKCEHQSDSTCAYAQDGNRFGSRPPVTKENYFSYYGWLSSPGWCSVITGVSNEKHGVARNRPEFQQVWDTTSQYYPSMFKYAKAAGLKTAGVGTTYFLSSPTPETECQYGIVDYECGATSPPHIMPLTKCNATSSCNLDYRISVKRDDEDDIKTTKHAIDFIRENKADLVMAHFANIDRKGHLTGWLSSEYKRQYVLTDSHVGRILDAVKYAVETRGETWLVVVVGDHGGHNISKGEFKYHSYWKGNHFDVYLEDEAVPFLIGVYGPGDDGKEVPTYEMDHPRHFDVMPTVLNWLRVPLSKSLPPIDGKVQVLSPSKKSNSRMELEKDETNIRSDPQRTAEIIQNLQYYKNYLPNGPDTEKVLTRFG